MIREYSKEVIGKYSAKQMARAYLRMFLHYDNFLVNYFNSLSTIIKFLRDSEYEKEDKRNNTQNYKVYREILFSQLSLNEMLLLNYYAHYAALEDAWMNNDITSKRRVWLKRESQWLKEDLRLYNVFYPNLSGGKALFGIFDTEDMENYNVKSKE
ncbi:putative phage abortive infection protein [Bacillus cereus group sp. BfR-BA-01312]|uniref:putative phage abortive infection protein n=1 Tax=Bacillus cereus group sp. BfR-BA-01312 TaxID=2920289 RepID=UPI001F5A5E38|nr:putative phage abortive infection protein [Bacillus cereus group sp. BfR-BA-01312]